MTVPLIIGLLVAAALAFRAHKVSAPVGNVELGQPTITYSGRGGSAADIGEGV